MDTETIKRQIQAENDSYNRDKNRLQQEILSLKQRHQRSIENLKRQKEQATSQNTNECIYTTLNNELEKFLYINTDD